MMESMEVFGEGIEDSIGVAIAAVGKAIQRNRTNSQERTSAAVAKYKSKVLELEEMTELLKDSLLNSFLRTARQIVVDGGEVEQENLDAVTETARQSVDDIFGAVVGA